MSLGRREQLGLLSLAGLLIGFTFTNPTAQIEQDRYRYVYVFDISQSMNVTDVPGAAEGVTRLAYAKKAAVESLTALPCGSEVGVALFSGHRAFLLITPIEICANYGELSAILGGVDWRMTWERRSEIAKGLHKSLTLLTALENETRLVFFTDGHEAPPINPDLPPRFPGEVGEILGVVVGVGGDSAVPIPKFDESGKQKGFWSADEVEHVDSFTQASAAREGKDILTTGTEHLSSLREPYLVGLAAKTGLTYHRLSDVDKFFRQLKSNDLSIPKTATSDIRWLFGLAALLVLAISMMRSQNSKQQ